MASVGKQDFGRSSPNGTGSLRVTHFSLGSTLHGQGARDCSWRIFSCGHSFAGWELVNPYWLTSPVWLAKNSALGCAGRCWTGTRRLSISTSPSELLFWMTGGRCYSPMSRFSDWRRRQLEQERAHHRGRAGGIGGGVAVCAAWRPGGALRDAAGAFDSGAPDRGLRGVGVLEFAEVGYGEYCALVIERGDAAGGIFADRNCAGVCGSGRARAGSGSDDVCGAGDGEDLAGASDYRMAG